tara:strand:- start:2948 stop:4495 length:1548 start_codon:yes stop_codon:yes gene_type:complete
MRKWLRIIGVLLAIALTKACDYDLSFSPAQTQDIRFSSDTVYLDTVFTSIGSSTYNLRIYNQANHNIKIGSIRLGQASDSQFRLNVDGMHGQDFNDVEILANDSIYVFIETTVNIKDYAANAPEFLYNDQLLVDEQTVELITLVKDAIFLYPKREDGFKEMIPLGTDEEGNAFGIEGFYLEDNELIFTNERPYVIYGYAGVPSEKTVRFEAGARIHFHDNSGLIAAESSSVHVLGEQSADAEMQEGEVIFEGDRLEPFFENIPGQWGAIWLTAGSTNHIFRHATIKNASVGILMDYNDETENPTLVLEQTQIHNSSAVGLWAKTGHVRAVNSIFGNAGNASFFGNIGGSYEFTHCTFANYWNRSFRSTPAVILNDYVPISETEDFVMPLEKAVFANCIIDGNQTVEFGVEQKGDQELSFSLDHTALRFSPADETIYENPYYDFSSSTLYPKLILNKQTAFHQPSTNDFRISQESEVIGLGKSTHAASVPVDLNGVDRTNLPDLGAFQHLIFEKED